MSDDERSPRRPADELRRIARYQRWVMAVILAQLALWAGFAVLAFTGRGVGDGVRFPMILTVILGGVGAVFSFLVCWTVRGAFSAVVMTLGALVPCLGLFVLTLVNGIATAALRLDGVKVGTFGADPDAIRDRGSLYDDEDAGW